MTDWMLIPAEDGYWKPINRGFNRANAKFICNKCAGEFPLEPCIDCGEPNYQLGTATFPGVFCAECENGAYVWDCPNCGEREKTIFVFHYDSSQLTVRKKRFWE